MTKPLNDRNTVHGVYRQPQSLGNKPQSLDNMRLSYHTDPTPTDLQSDHAEQPRNIALRPRSHPRRKG
jgi:hypothetical protein